MVAGSRRWLVAIGFCLMLLHDNAPNAENQRMKDGQQHREVETIVLGMGCFWGAEKRMAQIPGVIDVESGYANGEVEARYEAILDHERTRVRHGDTRRNYAEVVKVTFDPGRVSLESVLARFWEAHDPTQRDRQGNDVGSNYRSAIYTANEMQRALALQTRERYQRALTSAGRGPIVTEIEPLIRYVAAEDYHQDYLQKHPNGYCGLGGTGIPYPAAATVRNETPPAPRIDQATLHAAQQIIVFEAEDCPYCRKFATEVLANWQSTVPVLRTRATVVPDGWHLDKPLFATPTIVYFKERREVSRYTGYNGEKQRFWKWLGFQLLTPAQQAIAFEQGTERPFTGSYLDEKRPGRFVDPITGETLFRSDTKFDSGTGWPSFFDPVPGAITEHEDVSHGIRRVEIRSASSGIHLGHVFDDGPPPSYKRYCINGNVLRFVPDEVEKRPDAKGR